MYEQSPNQPQPNEIFDQITSNEHMSQDGQRQPTQAELDAAHEVARVRDHHETNAARALATLKLVEKAMSDQPEDIIGQLRQEKQLADNQDPDTVSPYMMARNMDVAGWALETYSRQKTIEDDRARMRRYGPPGPGPLERDMKAASFTVSKLRGSAFSSKTDADSAEHRLRHGSAGPL